MVSFLLSDLTLLFPCFSCVSYTRRIYIISRSLIYYIFGQGTIVHNVLAALPLPRSFILLSDNIDLV